MNLIDEARSINSSLRRVKQSMQVSVMMAQSATETVNQDGDLISDTLHEQKYSLKTALDYTKRSLRKMKFAQIMEKYSLYAALLFYSVAISYVLLKRTGVLGLVFRSMC